MSSLKCLPWVIIFLFESILGHCGKPLYRERKLSKKPLKHGANYTHCTLPL